MSKVVVLMGSPRNGGNTEILAKAFCEGARRKNDVELIKVCDFNVSPCIGCNKCFGEGNNCVQQDDMRIIFDAVAKADVLVIASPIYFYGISAQLKAVVDRFHTPKRNRLKVKKMGLLLVGASSLNSVFDSVLLQYQQVLNFFKLQDIGKVLVRNVKEKGEIKGNFALLDAFDLGLSIND